MRPQFVALLVLIVLTGSFSSSCRSTTASAPARESGPTGPEPAEAVFVGQFSGQRAWQHLAALASIGPRAAGTPGAEKAREYISSELAALGLAAERVTKQLQFGSEEEPGELEIVDLVASIPGASSDLILVIAPYDSAYREDFRFAGVNDGASGAAVLLELARVLIAKPLSYTTKLYFLDGEAALGRGAEGDRTGTLFGSRLAADSVRQAGEWSKVRLLLHLNRVSDADLRIARDRFSHRIYRDTFWRIAGSLGHREEFPVDIGFEAPDSGHRAFFDSGMRRVVTIEDTGFGDGETEFARYDEDDTLERSSEESLAIVGRVVLSGLREISASLQRIDRFSEAPTIPTRDVPANENNEAVEPPEAAAVPAGQPPEPDSSGAAETAPEPDASETAEPPSEPGT